MVKVPHDYDVQSELHGGLEVVVLASRCLEARALTLTLDMEF